MKKSSDEWHMEGRKLQTAGQLDLAVAAYQEALKLKATRLDTRNNLAVIMQKKGLKDIAEQLLTDGLRLAAKKWKMCKTQKEKVIVADDWARLLNSCNVQALQQKKFKRCLPMARRQIQLDPDGCGYVNLGVALEELGYPAKAAKSHLLGIQRYGLKWDKPEELIGRRLNNPLISSQLQRELSNLAICRLHTQPLCVEHWRLLLSRLGIANSSWSMEELPWENLWKGEFCNDLLIWDELGFGDALQCLRWVRECGQRTKQLTLMIRPELLRLIEQRLDLPANCKIVPLQKSGTPFEKHEKHCPIMGLPVALADGQTKISIPSTQTDHWLKRSYRKKKGQIGLVWAAGEKDTKDAQRASERRSISASQFLKHALTWKERWGIELISLQLGKDKNIVEDLVEANRIQQLKEGGDWESTATVVENLDLVVCVDTAMAHLAGNLGVPCLLLLNRVHDWRWGKEEEPVRWYQRQKVLRCKSNDDWENLLKEADSWVKELLHE